MDQIIRILRQKIKITHDLFQKLELEKEHKLGYCDALREVLFDLESRDLQYDEVDSEIAREALAEIKADPDKVLRGPALDAWNQLNEVESEEIAFIKELVKVWSLHNGSEIHRQTVWSVPSIDPRSNGQTFYDVARGIISRAKGAHDGGKQEQTVPEAWEIINRSASAGEVSPEVPEAWRTINRARESGKPDEDPVKVALGGGTVGMMGAHDDG